MELHTQKKSLDIKLQKVIWGAESVFGLTLQQRLAAKYQEEEGGTWCHEIFRMCMRFRQTAARKKWVVSSSNNFCSGKMIAVMPCDATQILSSLVTWSRHLPFQEFCNISMGWFSKQNDKDNLKAFFMFSNWFLSREVQRFFDSTFPWRILFSKSHSLLVV